jgi:hypothetical protein
MLQKMLTLQLREAWEFTSRMTSEGWRWGFWMEWVLESFQKREALLSLSLPLSVLPAWVKLAGVLLHPGLTMDDNQQEKRPRCGPGFFSMTLALRVESASGGARDVY